MPIPFEIYCPDASCPGKIEVGDDGIAFCSHCGMQVGVWSAPHPRGRRFLPSMRTILLLGMILLCSGVGFWAGGGLTADEHPALRSPAQIGYQEFVRMVKGGAFPSDLDLPAFYRDPNLFLREDQRRAQSGFVVFWNGLSDDQRLGILNALRIAKDPVFIPFLAEITYYTMPFETDEAIASGLLDTLQGSARPFLDLLVFLTEFVAGHAACPEVAEDARTCLVGLRARRQRYGR